MSNAWVRFVDKCRRKYGNPWDAPIDGAIPNDDIPTVARLTDALVPTLYFTKQTFFERLLDAEPEIAGANYLRRWATPTREYLRGLAAMLRYRPVLHFVGDLDPCDLAVFRALQTGSPDLVPRRGWPLSVYYAGVDSRWVELAERGSPLLRQCLIPMDPLERAQYRALTASWPELREVVGDRAADILNEGLKLEVEGATVHSFRNQSFRRQLVTFILGGTPEQRTSLHAIRMGAEAEALKAARSFVPAENHRMLLVGDLRNHITRPTNERAAIVALMNARDLVSGSVFTEVLQRQDGEPAVRGQAAEALGQVMESAGRRTKDWRQGARALLAALADRSPEVRGQAARALGVARVREALPALRRMSKDRARVQGGGTVGAEARAAVLRIEAGALLVGSPGRGRISRGGR